MPTAREYRSIATRLEISRDQVLGLLRPIAASIHDSPFDGAGGRLERTVDTTLAVSSANVTETVAELQRQIAEARRRAAVCERYAAAVRSYRRSSDPLTPFPRRPANWAEHGW